MTGSGSGKGVKAAGPPPGGASLPRTILANTGYVVAADALSKLAGLVLWVFMARALGEAGLGTFTYALAIVTLVTALGKAGQDRVLTREVARDQSLLPSYFWNTLALRLLVTLPALGSVLALAALLGLDGRTLAVVTLLGLATAADLLTATCLAAFQAFERLAFVPVIQVPQRFAVAAAVVAALLMGADVVVVAAVHAAVAALTFPLALVLLRRRITRPPLALTPATWRQLLLAALPIGLGGLFATVVLHADAVLLGWLETRQVVGNYGAAHRLFDATLFLSWAVGAAVLPVFSRLTPASDPPLARVFERALKLLLAGALPLAVGAAAFAGPVVDTLYGAEYEQAKDALVLVAPAIVAYPVVYLSTFLLIARNRAGISTAMHGGAAALNVGLNAALIPALSLEGAAIALSVSQVALGAVLFTLVRRTTGAMDWPRMAAGPLLAAAAQAAALLALAGTPLVAVAAAGLAYLGVLVIFERLAYPADARLAWRFLRRAAP